MKTYINNGDGSQAVIAVEDGKLYHGTVNDSTAVAEYAKAKHNAGEFGSSDMRHACTIDGVHIEKYLNENGITWHEFSHSEEHKRRFLMDPRIAHFRIWKGRI